MVTRHPSSYRDPSGFLFYNNDILYRQVNLFFKDDWDLFLSSGLYEHLVQQQLLLQHAEISKNLNVDANWYKTLQPQFLPLISYPYEWCFDMWKDAALVTLQAAKDAMKYGMMLKDASAYNVQWHDGQMIFIDTLSFEKYDETQPWVAYRQFSEHFLVPLALMHYLKMPLQNLFLSYPDGIPISLAKKLLPFKSKLNLHSYLHLHVQGNAVSKKTADSKKVNSFSKKKMENILNSLEAAIHSYSFNSPSGVWSGYYDEANSRDNYVTPKKEIIKKWITSLNVKSAIDVGANEGEFSELLSNENIFTISADFDHFSINNLYKKIKNAAIKNWVPLLLDASAPSPAIGVNNLERSAFTNRVKTDLVMALALIHHLALGKNIPFDDIARFLKNFGKLLIIEFVPKEDEKVRIMLHQKKDVYQWYTKQNFLASFSQEYKIIHTEDIADSGRTLYLMEAHEN